MTLIQFATVGILGTALAMGGCKAKEMEEAETEETVAPETEGAPATAPKTAEGEPGTTAPLTEIGVELDEGLTEACDEIDRNKVFFRFDSAKLTDAARSRLRDVATCLDSEELSDRKLLAVGFTDPRGTDEYNQKLGKSRAESVKELLVGEGLDENRVEVESRGEEPAQPGAEQAFPFDRRVRLQLQGAQQ